MYKCLFCGLVNKSDKARICIECGPEVMSKDWKAEEIDQLNNVIRYAKELSDIYFASPANALFESISNKMREMLKISHDAHVKVISNILDHKKKFDKFSKIKIEYNKNVVAAYAGHDTYLNFRVANLSEEYLYKVSMYWENSEIANNSKLEIHSKNYIGPNESIVFGGTVVFDRIGVKEISDLKLNIVNQYGESAEFRVESFNCLVENPSKNITQNITTHNQISIEGRGVIDASGLNSSHQASQSESNHFPIWKNLNLQYITNYKEKENLLDQKINTKYWIEKILIMYGSIIGKVINKSPPVAIIEMAGVQYETYVAMDTFYNLPENGSNVHLLTHSVIFEDKIYTYGFDSSLQREMFRDLIQIDGIGARSALGILSGISSNELKEIVEKNEIELMPAIPGISHEKIKIIFTQLKIKMEGGKNGRLDVISSDFINEIKQTLVSLGCNYNEIDGIVSEIPLNKIM